jgi:hypothetical protein
MHAHPDRGWLMSGWWYLNCDSCLKETRVRTGYYIVGTVDRSFLYRNLERFWDWSSTEKRPDGLLRRPYGCKLDRNFSTQWRVRTEVHVSGRMMLGLIGVRTVWHVVRTDGTVVRCASGQDGSIVRTTNRELKSSFFHSVQSLLRVLWIMESLFTASLHTQVILSKMRPKY